MPLGNAATGAPVLPPKPVPPDPGECCGGGCARCVFDVYEEQLERWERECAEILGPQPSPSVLVVPERPTSSTLGAVRNRRSPRPIDTPHQ